MSVNEFILFFLKREREAAGVLPVSLKPLVLMEGNTSKRGRNLKLKNGGKKDPDAGTQDGLQV